MNEEQTHMLGVPVLSNIFMFCKKTEHSIHNVQEIGSLEIKGYYVYHFFVSCFLLVGCSSKNVLPQFMNRKYRI